MRGRCGVGNAECGMMKGCGGLLFVVSLITEVARGQGVPPLQPPHGELLPTFWEQHGWQVILAGAVMLGLVALLIGWLRRTKPVVVEAPVVVARRELEILRGHAEEGALVVEVSRIFKHYVRTIFGFSPDEWTTAEWRKELQAQSRLSPELVADINEFMRRCDEWKFAPVPATPQLNAVAGALDLVGKIELAGEQGNKEVVG